MSASKPQVFAGLTSPFPRSERVVTATRDLDRRRTTAEAVSKTYAEAEAEVVALEERLFTYVTGGYLRWNDMFRPLIESWSGLSAGPLTRWLETNTFFRQPVLSATPARVPGAFASRLPPPLAGRSGESRVLFPGPHTFVKVIEDRTGGSDGRLVEEVGRLLGEEAREMSGLGFRQFQFSDPFLVTDPPEGSEELSVLGAYRSIADAVPGATTAVWTYGASAAPALPFLDRLPVSLVGVDLTDTDPESLRPGPPNLGLGLGIVDPRTTLPESVTETVDVIREALRKRPSSTVWLGPGAPLDLLPQRPAEQKLLRLSDVRHSLLREGFA